MIVNSLTNIIKPLENDVFSITGFGGKTTVMYLIGHENKDKKVLLTTSTKIFKNNYYTQVIGDEAALLHKPVDGVTIICNNDKDKNKLKPLRYGTLKRIVNKFDYTLIESDGAKQFLLKGYNENEPIIYDITKTTIGVVTLKKINANANEQNVFRLNEFLSQTGLKYNESIIVNTFANLILNNNCIFKNSLGRKILIINQVESLEELVIAKNLKDILLNQTKIEFDKIIIGSCKENKWIEELN